MATFKFPGAVDTKLLWGAAIVFFALLIAAVLIEVLRHTVALRRRLDAEWRTIKEIANEKGISEQEWRRLRALIRRWARREPLRTITVRHQFDKCAEAEMDSLFAKGATRSLEEAAAALRDIRERLGLDFVPLGQRIHSTRELYPGQPIWISRASEKVPKWVRLNASRLDEAYFYVVTQNSTQDKPRFHPGEAVRCRMWREEDARYVFTVLFVRSTDDPPTWVFRHTSDLNRVQSRAHFRVKHDQSTTVSLLRAIDDSDMEDLEQRPVITKLRGRITSLSAGGLALVIPETPPKQVALRVTLDLPESEPFELTARIVSHTLISGERCFIRAAFVGIDDETRDTIARYVLKRQQPLLASGESEE